jgi:hypothetical protein
MLQGLLPPVNPRRVGFPFDLGVVMDMSLVMAALSAQTGAMQQQVATAALKSNLDAQKSTVLTLLGADQQAPSLANVAAGVGGNVNIAA